MSALAGIKVLELGRVLAGPWAGQMLADLGAEVIKVEHPRGGDDTRGWGPPVFPHSDGSPSAQSAYFLAANRAKKSIAVDFSQPQGLALVQELADRCDVVIENFRVGALRKYALDYDSIAARNPGVIYCSITGFGQTGPRRHQGGYDFVVQALGGLMSVTGQPDGTPGGEPMKVGVPVTDLFTGMYAATGILAALNARHASGRGQAIDLSLFDVQIAMLANQGMNYLVSGKVPVRLGNDHPNVVPCGTYATADGYLVLTIGSDVQFERLCEAMDLRHLLDDARFGANAGRSVHRDALNQLLTERFAARTTEDWLDRFDQAKVPAAPVNTVATAFDDRQARARGLKIDIPASYGLVPTIANPLRLSDDPVPYDAAPPMLGQHTDEVLRERLGLSPHAVAALCEAGIVRLHEGPPAAEGLNEYVQMK